MGFQHQRSGEKYPLHEKVREFHTGNTVSTLLYKLCLYKKLDADAACSSIEHRRTGAVVKVSTPH